MERHISPRLRIRMLIVIMVAYFATSNAAASDISCLSSIKDLLKDSSGNFSSSYDDEVFGGSSCGIKGVGCSHGTGTVISIELAGKRLRGPFPIGIIRNCTNLSKLDISSNYFSGPIPSDLGDSLPNIVDLNLSNNSLSGPIPPTIVKWWYINFLRLNNNHLTGEIPPDLTGLGRIKVFNVANNKLSGPVPIFSNSNVSAESYANNSGLCGGPLKACKGDDDDELFLSGFAVGFSLFTIITMLFIYCFFP